MRGTRAFRGVVLASVIVAAIGSQTRPAFALDPPATTPTFTAPTTGSTVGGFVTMTATSSAPAVQFFAWGGPLGAPVPVVDGSASSTPWETWGATNGSAEISAADCNDAGCGQPTSLVVNISNPAPVITAPLDGATTNPLPDISATASGGSVRFQVDAQTAVDVSPPFQFTPTEPLAAGQHTVIAQTCNTAGTGCAGSSELITITVAFLHPSITKVIPNPFSPNGDGRDDSATVIFSLPDPEAVTWTVTDPLGSVEQGPNSLGPLSAGPHSFVWSGLDNAHVRVPQGTYTVVLSTAATVNGMDFTGSATGSVKVDTTAPIVGVPTGRNTTFYPVRDGYRDTFATRVSVNEPGTLWLDIRTADGRSVRLVKLTHSQAGSFALAWGGLNASGHLVPAGTYHFRIIADDVAGNRRTGATYNVVVSLRHLVTKTAAITKHGSAFDFVDGSKSCAGGSAGQSAFKPTGLRLFNLCSTATTEVGLAQYSFGLPAAISYSSLHVESYGFSPDAPVGVATLIWNFPRDDADVVSGVAVRNRTKAWTSLGGITASQHVSGGHIVQIAIGLLNVSSPALYDIGLVRLTVTYRVLS